MQRNAGKMSVWPSTGHRQVLFCWELCVSCCQNWSDSKSQDEALLQSHLTHTHEKCYSRQQCGHTYLLTWTPKPKARHNDVQMHCSCFIRYTGTTNKCQPLKPFINPSTESRGLNMECTAAAAAATAGCMAAFPVIPSPGSHSAKWSNQCRWDIARPGGLWVK